MDNIWLIIGMNLMAVILFTAVGLIWKKVEKNWKWTVIFILSCLGCFCLFWQLNIYQDMYDAKHPQVEEPIDTLKMINELKRRAGYEVFD